MLSRSVLKTKNTPTDCNNTNMNETNWWDSANASLVYNAFKQHLLPQNISGPSRSQSRKVPKSTSRRQSPRDSSRRRMTTTLPARTRSVIDRRQNPLTHAMGTEQMRSTRPVSWHPNFQAQDVYQMNGFEYQQQLQHSLLIQPQTMYANGLITPNFQPSSSDCMECPEYHLDQTNSMEPFPQYQTMQPYPELSTDMSNYDSTTCNSVGLQNYYDPMSNHSWSVPMDNMQNQILTAPTSPAFLPMPEVGEPFSVPHQQVSTSDNVELVALGLYDSPAQAQSSTLLLTGSLPVRRKSLKLEESFIPTSEPDDEDDAESEPEPTPVALDSGVADFVMPTTQYQDCSMLLGQGFDLNAQTPFMDAQGMVMAYDAHGYPSQAWI